MLRPQLRVVQAQRIERAGRLGLEHDVGLCGKGTEIRRALRGVQVENDAALRRVVVPPPQTPVRIDPVVDERPVVARPVSAWRFDHDDVGPQVAEKLAGVRGSIARQLQHPKAFEHPLPFAQMMPADASASISESERPSSSP